MKCPQCNFTVPATAHVVRCLNCGGLIKPDETQSLPAPTESRATSEVLYETPYGKFKAQIQPSTDWAAAYRLASLGERHNDGVRLIRNLISAYGQVSSPLLPRLHRFDEQELRTIWSFPAVPELLPLARHTLPWKTTPTVRLVVQLAEILKQLHSIGLGICDWSPSLIFATQNGEAVVPFPSPWMPTLILWQPIKSVEVPFIAPEFRERPTESHDPLRADIFGLGTLVHYLITGKPRSQDGAVLPSETQTSFAIWDALIDGCCRSNPARRFGTIDEALACLPTGPDRTSGSRLSSLASPIKQQNRDDRQVEPLPTPSWSRSWTNRRVLLAIAIVGMLIGYLRRDQIASILPGAGDLLAPYERGFGDTVIRYQDRSYAGSSWKPLKESQSLSTIASIGNEDTFGALAAISGWSDDSFWILDRWGNAFQQRDGHWFIRGKLRKEGYLELRLLDEDTVLCAGSRGTRHHICKIAPQGVTEYGPLERVGFSNGFHSIAPIASDLFYFLGDFPDDRVYKVANGELKILYPDRDKEVYVHRADNTPLKEYPVEGIECIRGTEAGQAYGITKRGYFSEYKIVEFRNGLWYDVTSISAKSVNDAWYFCEGGVLKHAVVVGDKGHVLFHPMGTEAIDQSVTTAQETTSLRLIGVWGASADKYWVMDENGTVWERDGTLWRTVVQGLYRDGVKFNDAWVSPTGSVFAITDDVLYRLE